MIHLAPKKASAALGNNYMKNNKFFICSCHSHALNLVKFNGEDECYISIWISGHQNPGWKYKLRQIWHIIKTGTPYEDEVVLPKEEALNLSKYINKLYAEPRTASRNK